MPLSSRFVSKEALGAFERWQPSSFAGTASADGGAEGRAALAHAQGFEQGQREGFAAGAQLAAAQARQLTALLDGIGCEIRVLGDRAARETLELAVAIARQIVRREIENQPEAILPVVAEAMNCLPRGTREARLLLHPTDAKVVGERMAEELKRIEWRIVESSQLRTGECRIEAGCGDVDATFETRWARVLAALGENHDE